jgi:hypothetical protein
LARWLHNSRQGRQDLLQALCKTFYKLFAAHKTHERAKTHSQTDNKMPYNSVYFAYNKRKQKNSATPLPSSERSTEAKQMRFKQNVWNTPARHNLFDWRLQQKVVGKKLPNGPARGQQPAPDRVLTTERSRPDIGRTYESDSHRPPLALRAAESADFTLC